DGCAARRGFYFVAKSAAGKIPASGGGRLTVGLVRIGLEKHGALEFRIAAKLHPQLIHLLGDERLHVAVTSGALIWEAGKVRILRGECSQKCAHEIHIAMRQMKLRIVFVEEQRVARLAVRG